MAHDTYGTKCEQCHNASSWLGAKVAHPEFGLPHHNATCAQCHTTPTDPMMFTCLTSGCHPQAESDSRHRSVGGYMYEPTACYRCHKGGCRCIAICSSTRSQPASPARRRRPIAP